MMNLQNASTKPHLVILNLRLVAEHAAWTERENTPSAEIYRKSQVNVLDAVKALGQEGNITAILSAEKMILDNELRLYGNSSGMRKSLGAALHELKQAEKHRKMVKDKDSYALVDSLFQRPKNRHGGLTYDEARQFFSAHKTRLLNQDRSRLSETEKQTLKVRRSNIRIAEKAYITLQQQALGIDPSRKKSKDQSLSL
jgi:hypothetical protein